MTQILGVNEPHRCWIGGDSRLMRGWAYSDRGTKVFREHGFIWGFSGELRAPERLRRMDPPAPDRPDRMLQALLDPLVEWFHRTKGQNDSGFCALAAYGGPNLGMWLLHSDGGVLQVYGPCTALGDTTAAAAAYYALEPYQLDTHSRIVEAIQATSRVNACVGGHVSVLSVSAA